MKKTFLLSCLLMVLGLTTAFAQIQDPVQFKSEWKKISDTEAQIVFTGVIDEGWHVYSTDLPDGGPISATFNTDTMEGIELDGKLMPEGKEIEAFDKVFDMNLRYFEEKATFVQKLKITAATYFIEGFLQYGSCNDENCLPPTNIEFSFSGKGAEGAAASQSEEIPAMKLTEAVSSNVSTADYWAPVIDKLNAFGEETAQTSNQSWFYIFFAGFIGGLLALFTPCVWPIIPMTVSFFLKRSKDKKKGIRDAWTYGASIVVIYVTLGLAITLIFGASALNALSTNAVFNILFFLMLVVFAASFFGAFEITLPSKWSNAVDSKAEQTSGLLSIFLMAFTLSLVSFSCTGPIIGFLLVEVSTTGSVVAPAIGMLGFALALALPFTLFAMFPSWLKQMPKSGGWMNVIKVTLGFLELAFALKFLSVADLAYGWRILDRETFLALWIVIFGLMGFYLLGKIKFPHDDDDTTVSVPRFFMALCSLAFAVYMVPGLWGAPLKAVSAFAPPMNTQDFNLYKNEVHAQFDDFDAGMEYARRNGKPVMLDFTGYGCVNCRKMELAVWTDQKVSKLIQDDYVLITLYVDNKTPLPENIKVTENGKERTLRTLGDNGGYLNFFLSRQGRSFARRTADDDSIDALAYLKFGQLFKGFYICFPVAERSYKRGCRAFEQRFFHYFSPLRFIFRKRLNFCRFYIIIVWIIPIRKKFDYD